MTNVTKTELVRLFQSIKGNTAISMVAETEADMNKKNNPYYGTRKTNTIAGLIGFDYENSVNNQLGREDKDMDFVARKPVWAVGTDCRHIVTNKDGSELYVYIKVQSAGTPSFSFNGQPVDAEVVKPYIKEHKKPMTQDGLEKEIVVRMFKVSNILSVKMLGEEYRVTDRELVGDRTAVIEPVNPVNA